jgi:hypothetical protein
MIDNAASSLLTAHEASGDVQRLGKERTYQFVVTSIFELPD